MTSSLTAQAGPGACSGSVQISSDGYTTCVGVTTVTWNGDNTVASLIMASNFSATTSYSIKVLTSVATTANEVLDAAFLSTFTTAAPPDVTVPTVGTPLSFSSIANNSMTVNWGAGSDNLTPLANLTYKLVMSSGATTDIDTIAEVDAITAPNMLLNYATNTTTFNVTGLSGGSTYHFAVVVQDQAGNKALYTPASQATTIPSIRIYTDGNLSTGNLGNRATSTATCQTMQTTAYPGLSCTSHLAFVSYTGDAILDFPSNHTVPGALPILSHNGTMVSPDWSQLMGTLTNTLQAAGVATTTPTPFFWTSSATGGGFDATFNCTNNTDGTVVALGSQGSITTTASTWLRFAINQPCNGSVNSAYLMCICW